MTENSDSARPPMSEGDCHGLMSLDEAEDNNGVHHGCDDAAVAADDRYHAAVMATYSAADVPHWSDYDGEPPEPDWMHR